MLCDIGLFAGAGVSGTMYSLCEKRIRYTGVDMVGTSRSYQTLGLDRNRVNIVPRTSPAVETWLVIGTTNNFDLTSHCKSHMIRDTIDTVCQSRIGLLEK